MCKMLILLQRQISVVAKTNECTYFIVFQGSFKYGCLKKKLLKFEINFINLLH